MDLSPYASAAEVHSVEGRVGYGKTQRLVEAVLDLLARREKSSCSPPPPLRPAPSSGALRRSCPLRTCPW